MGWSYIGLGQAKPMCLPAPPSQAQVQTVRCRCRHDQAQAQICRYLKHSFTKTIPKIYICWVIVAETNFQKVLKFFWKIYAIFLKISVNLNGPDETFPKKYICLGIVGDSNFTNVHQFSDKFSESVQKILTGLTRQFQKCIYVGVLQVIPISLIFTNFQTNFLEIFRKS